MRDAVTTALDTLGLLLIAVGLGLGAYGLIVAPRGLVTAAQGAGSCVAGVTLLVGTWLADRAAARHTERHADGGTAR